MRFGTTAAHRYTALIQRSFMDIALEPRRPGVRIVTLAGASVGLYHIRHSRTQIGPASERVRTPRHLVVFDVDDERILILGLVHETMDRPSALRRLLDPAAEPEAG